MKRKLLLSIGLLTFTYGIAQNDTSKENSKETNDVSIVSDTYNKWIVELSAGMSKGTNPYNPGYFAGDPDTTLGDFNFNSYNVGIRYMFSPIFGLKLGGGYDKFENVNGTKSLPFETEQIRVDFQGVVNGARLFQIQEDLGRFTFLLHAGGVYSRLTPKLASGPNYDNTENDLGIIFGVMPEFRISKKFSIFADFYGISNFRQHYTWDGNYSAANNNLTGGMINASIGITYSIGEDDMHGDWAIIESKNTEEFDALEARVGLLETMMDDSDKDGVPDYLDVEQNSIAGVAVDTKGRMIDMNKNGVPDELEKYLDNTYVDKANISQTIESANTEMIQKLINDGYVTAYFDLNKSTPTAASNDGIDFILTYLRANPSSNVDIIGYADATGKTAYNDKLALKRANDIKDTLTKAGIDASRMTAISGGVDDTVQKSSVDARKLVGKVVFKLK